MKANHTFSYTTTFDARLDSIKMACRVAIYCLGQHKLLISKEQQDYLSDLEDIMQLPFPASLAANDYVEALKDLLSIVDKTASLKVLEWAAVSVDDEGYPDNADFETIEAAFDPMVKVVRSTLKLDALKLEAFTFLHRKVLENFVSHAKAADAKLEERTVARNKDLTERLRREASQLGFVLVEAKTKKTPRLGK